MSIPIHRLAIYAASFISVLAAVDVILGYRSGLEVATPAIRASGTVTTLLVLCWLLTHPKLPSRLRPSFDHGLLVWMTFPVGLTHHIWAIYRWKALLIVLAVLALIFLPEIALLLSLVVG